MVKTPLIHAAALYPTYANLFEFTGLIEGELHPTWSSHIKRLKSDIHHPRGEKQGQDLIAEYFP
jgi:hypothetical protein